MFTGRKITWADLVFILVMIAILAAIVPLNYAE